jgi:hypothetical protein
MNPRSAAEVAFGVAGIWLMVSRIPGILLSLAPSPAEPVGVVRWFGLLHFGLVAGCGLGLLLLRHRLATWLVPLPQPALSGSVPDIQAAAFSVVGLLMAAHGLAELLARLVMSTSIVERSSFWRLATPLVQLVVGLAVFFGARGVVTIWWWCAVLGSHAAMMLVAPPNKRMQLTRFRSKER